MSFLAGDGFSGFWFRDSLILFSRSVSQCPTSPATISRVNLEICEPRSRTKPKTNRNKSQLSLSDQIRIKSASDWLMLGEADEVERELEALPGRVWDHRLAVEVRVAALETLQERNGAGVQI